MINVLIVDDHAMISELNKTYMNQVKGGFTCTDVARALAKAEALLMNMHRSDRDGSYCPPVRAISGTTAIHWLVY